MADMPPDDAIRGSDATPPTGWFVALAGPSHDLHRLTQLNLQSFTVVEQEKWTCLKSALFEPLDDHNAVLNCAEQIAIPRVRGLATLLDAGRSFASVSAEGHVFRYDENGHRDGLSFFLGGVQFTATATLYVDAIGGRSAPPDPFPIQADAAASLPEVDQVLSLFGAIDQSNWTTNTFKIWELISYDLGAPSAPQKPKQAIWNGNKAIENLIWLTPDELDRLRSVHDPTITGTLSRHAVQTRPSPENPIHTSSEAIAILRKLIKAWIQHRYRQQAPDATTSSTHVTPDTDQSRTPTP